MYAYIERRYKTVLFTKFNLVLARRQYMKPPDPNRTINSLIV